LVKFVQFVSRLHLLRRNPRSSTPKSSPPPAGNRFLPAQPRFPERPPIRRRHLHPRQSTGHGGPRRQLFQRIQFATDVNPMARIAHGLYRGKFLRAVSVGFIPLRWQNADGTEHQVSRVSFRCIPSPPQEDTIRDASPSLGHPSCGGLGKPLARREGRFIPHSPLRTPHSTASSPLLEQELLEVSAVAIPANPNALALAQSGALEKSDLRDLADLIAPHPRSSRSVMDCGGRAQRDAALASQASLSSSQRVITLASAPRSPTPCHLPICHLPFLSRTTPPFQQSSNAVNDPMNTENSTLHPPKKTRVPPHRHRGGWAEVKSFPPP